MPDDPNDPLRPNEPPELLDREPPPNDPVLEREPFPDLALPLLHRTNVTVTPHIAWYSDDAVRELGVLAADEALRYLRGEQPRAVLNPAAQSLPVRSSRTLPQ